MLRRTICTLLVSGIFLLPAFAQKQEVKLPNSVAGRPFSAGIIAGDTLYVSGMVGRTADGKIPDSFEDEVKQTLDNINDVVKAAGYTIADAVSVQVYLTDMSLFERMNKIYTPYFPEPRPTRTTVGVTKLVGTSKIEITLTASKASAGKKKKK